MSNATHDLCGYETLILAEVSLRREVVGQFHLLYRILGLPNTYWGVICLRRLHQRGLVQIIRPGEKRSIIIRSVQQ
jgi:hypothetical protein